LAFPDVTFSVVEGASSFLESLEQLVLHLLFPGSQKSVQFGKMASQL
jgi:hypothetical protein